MVLIKLKGYVHNKLCLKINILTNQNPEQKVMLYISRFPPDCENLIRKMLVVDPAKRISIAQIKQHRWMLADPSAPHQTLSHSLTDYNSNLGDYSEPVLSIMHTLGIDRQRTVEVRITGRYGGAARVVTLGYRRSGIGDQQ